MLTILFFIILAIHLMRRSAEATAYHRWYSTARWQALRKQQLQKDPLCKFCLDTGQVTEATVADHITEHKGDPLLFWDASNLQSLCTSHHSGDKQQIEKRGYANRVGADGWPTDARHPVNGAGGVSRRIRPL